VRIEPATRQPELLLEHSGAPGGGGVELRVPQLVEEDAERRDEAERADGDQLGTRPRPAEEADRDARQGRDEREQLEADVGERAQELRRLLVVEPEAVVGGTSLPAPPGGALQRAPA
jgi:hypothetical protein